MAQSKRSLKNGILVPKTLKLLYFLRLFNRIRWVVGVAALAAVAVTQYVLDLCFPYPYLYATVGAIFVYNTAFVVVVSALSRRTDDSITGAPEIGPTRLIALLQINCDFLALFTLLHFSGGLENPFIMIAIVHVVVSATLLETGKSLMEAFIATALLFAMGISEKMGWIAHYHPTKIIGENDPTSNWLFVLGLPSVMGVTIFALAGIIIIMINERARRRDQILALSGVLEEKNIKLLRIDEMRKGLLRVASHDLKAPIGAVASYLMTLKGGYLGDLNDKQMRVIERSLARLERLGDFIADILSLQAIQRGELRKNIREVDILPVLNDAIDNVQDRIEEKNIVLVKSFASDIPLISVAPERVFQVFDNLISNAVKYTPDAGEISINAYVQGDEFIFEVRDNGIGISAEDQESLFDEFFRASTVKQDFEGTGLGLSVVKRIVKAHNGRIWVTSELRLGSTFFVALPMHKGPLTLPPPSAAL